ncbi:hypothetical protein OCU04_011262 [Sclerotinia nivalis]|uniref:Uncharacterized protein n=1 Tax=Sclerotinia nivalis TaxID=352851 RepID=A0A9X0ABD5_9HELO|nr:hypothetical protein OCU04_011262 [Sclerotinia nivalis]
MTSQTLTLPLLRGTTTLEAALEQEENMLLGLAYPELRLDFFVWLSTHRADIEDTVSYHLGLTGYQFTLTIGTSIPGDESSSDSLCLTR